METQKRIEEIHEAMNRAADGVKAEAPRVHSRELIELVFSQPHTRIAFLEAAGIARRQTASNYLKELERIGILRGVKLWREVLYLNPDLLRILSS